MDWFMFICASFIIASVIFISTCLVLLWLRMFKECKDRFNDL